MARVTVFIPTYNRAGLLPHAVAGVLAQTHDDFELIVSDNSSTDGTPDAVASFDDPRLRYVRQEENLGLLGNYNWFLDQVESEYALILPDDDLVYPELLERTVAELDRHPEAGVAHAAFDVIDGDGTVLLSHVNWTYGLEENQVESAREFIAESMRWSCRVCSSMALMRTAALPPGRMVVEDLPAIDFGMWLRMAADGWGFAYLDEALGAYRIHGATYSAEFGPPQGPGYVQGIEVVSHLNAIKLEFLKQHNGAVEDARILRRLAEEARRRELVIMARNLTLPERRTLPTFRALAEAARADPGLLLEAPAWKLAAASLIGPRLTDRIKGLRKGTS